MLLNMHIVFFAIENINWLYKAKKNLYFQSGFCFIDGSAYDNGTKSPTSNCRVCYSNVTAYDWSESFEAGKIQRRKR